MGANKQAEKQRRKLLKMADKIRSVKEKSEKKIHALREENRLLEREIARLRERLGEAPDRGVGREPPEVSDGKNVFGHRIDWTRYAYLHDRYEAHIENGAKKEEARKLANRDLVEKFGKEAGYTDQQLKCIFL